MAQDVVQVLTVKTGNSEKTIKDLRKEIADLKKTLETTAIGTEDFKRASDELATAQANLKTVLADGKAVTDAVEGSYNHLAATMANLKKEWKATADEVKRNEIGAKIDEINTKLKKMDASIGNNQRNVGNYKDDIIGAFQEIKVGTDTYKEDWKKVSDATEKTRAKFESVQKTAAGLTAGFAAVQGTMALLGTENEALEKTFVKVQSAMAIAQGVGGLKDLIEGVSKGEVAFKGAGMGAKTFTTSLSGVQKAILATGIGALVVALGALIANWDKVSKALGFNTEVQKKQAEAAKKAAEEQEKALNRIGNAASKPLVQFKEFERQYKNLKTQSEKTQWIKDNASAFDELGLSIKGIVDAENIFINNTDDYVNAIITRAMATAKEEELAELAAKAAKQKASADATYTRKMVKAGDKSYGGSHTTEGGYEYVDRNGNWVYTKKGAERQNTFIKSSTYAAYNQTINEMEKVANEIAQISQSISNKLVKTTKTTSSTTTSTAEDAANRAKNIAENARKSLIDTKEEEEAELKRIYEEEKALLEQYGIDTANLTEQYEKQKSDIVTKYANESKKRLSESFDGIDKNAEKDVYVTERAKPKSNTEWGAAEVEIEKLTKLKSITEETMKLKIAAIEQEQLLWESSSERWKELENEKVAVREQANKTMLEFDDQLAAQSKLRIESIANTTIQSFTQALSSASQIISALQENIDTTTEDGFEKNKKIQIANAVIQTLVGVTNALSGAFTTKSGPWDIALAAVQASTIAATGAIQVSNIKKQTYDGGSSDVANPSVSPMVNLGNNMPISYTRNLLTDSETTEMNKNTKVIVVESDITDTQDKVRVAETNSSF